MLGGMEEGVCDCFNGGMASVPLLQQGRFISPPPTQRCLNNCYDDVLENLCESSRGNLDLFEDESTALIESCCVTVCRGLVDEARNLCI